MSHRLALRLHVKEQLSDLDVKLHGKTNPLISRLKLLTRHLSTSLFQDALMLTIYNMTIILLLLQHLKAKRGRLLHHDSLQSLLPFL